MNADKTVIDGVIDRICIQENVIRDVIKQADNDIADYTFGVGRRQGTAPEGGISRTVRGSRIFALRPETRSAH